jgi:hypothetical protein
MLTVIVTDLEASRAALKSRQLSLGPSSGGDFARIAQISESTAIKSPWRSPARRSGGKHEASRRQRYRTEAHALIQYPVAARRSSPPTARGGT